MNCLKRISFIRKYTWHIACSLYLTDNAGGKFGIPVHQEGRQEAPGRSMAMPQEKALQGGGFGERRGVHEG